MVYGFTVNDSLDLIGPEKHTLPKDTVRIDASDAIAFAQMRNKMHYDREHHPQYLREGDHAALRLHHSYDIPATQITGKKYGQQVVGPFRVLERIGRLAYRLELPAHWQLHPVFSIAQLESCPDPATDPYHRPRPDNPEAVNTERDDLPEEWEVERILDKRVIKRGRGFSTQYLLRWKGYGSYEDRWTRADDVFADDLIAEYEDHASRGVGRVVRWKRRNLA